MAEPDIENNNTNTNTSTSISNTNTSQSNTNTSQSNTNTSQSNTNTSQSNTNTSISNTNTSQSNTNTSQSNTNTSQSNTNTSVSNNDANGPKSYKQINDYIANMYNTTNTNNSNILDILGMYVKGQKILYTEAKTTCEQRLSCLMLPSIFFTVVCSISNLLLKNYIYGNLITSILNGAIAFILAVINYLKLDARAEAHRSSAYKYDKLLSYIEFQSAKQLFLSDAKTKMYEIIDNIETHIREIKETNQFVLPETIRYNFPNLANSNIFTEVKNIGIQEQLYINELTNIQRDIMNIQTDIRRKNQNKEDNTKNREDLDKLKTLYDYTIINILKLKEKYTSIDTDFKRELDSYSKRNRWRPMLIDLLKV